jgi:hypothetical protein
MDKLNAILEQYLKLERLIPSSGYQRFHFQFTPTTALAAHTIRGGEAGLGLPTLIGDLVEIDGATHAILIAVTLDTARTLIAVPWLPFRAAVEAGNVDLGELGAMAYVLPDGTATFVPPEGTLRFSPGEELRAYTLVAALEGQDPKAQARGELAERLRKAQATAGLTDAELAAAAGLRSETLAGILAGAGAPKAAYTAVVAALAKRGAKV